MSTYNKILPNEKKNEYTTTKSARLTPCQIGDVRYDSFKQASDATGIKAEVIRGRCVAKGWTEYIYLKSEKKAMLTTDEMREAKRKTSKLWNKKYQESGHYRKYYARKKEVDVQYRLKTVYSLTVRNAIKHNRNSQEFEMLTGITVEGFRKHLTDMEPTFFDDWSRYGFNLDHILPVVKFDLTKITDVLTCYSYKNYQVLSAEANRSKGVS